MPKTFRYHVQPTESFRDAETRAQCELRSLGWWIVDSRWDRFGVVLDCVPSRRSVVRTAFEKAGLCK